MGSELNSVRRKIEEPARKIRRPIEKSLRQGLEKPFRTGASATKRDASKLLKTQQQLEKTKLAEADSEIATSKALSKKGGRKSLIKSAPSALATNLGGT